MKTKAGLWIDHRKAVIVVLADQGEEIGLILSKAERQLERSGDSPPKGSRDSRQLPPEDNSQRAFRMHLGLYYDAVVATLRKAESILIFGPGEAKTDLQKRLVKNKLGARIAAVEPADRMTDRQVAAKVRKYFAN
jgi:hypothetical protein